MNKEIQSKFLWNEGDFKILNEHEKKGIIKQESEITKSLNNIYKDLKGIAKRGLNGKA